MAVWQGPGMTSGGRGRLRAAQLDRDRAVELLAGAYAEGRLTKDEHDARLGRALSGTTYADLDAVLRDLPGATVHKRTNTLAIASLACGIGQVMAGPLTSIPAIVLGHMARSQIRRTGERGTGLALAGLTLGWAAVILGIVLVLVGLAVSPGMHGPMHMH